MARPDATLQGAAKVQSTMPVLPPQMSGPEGAHTQIAQEHADHDSELRGMADATGSAPQNTPQEKIDNMIASSLQQQEIIGEAQGTTPGL